MENENQGNLYPVDNSTQPDQSGDGVAEQTTPSAESEYTQPTASSTSAEESGSSEASMQTDALAAADRQGGYTGAYQSPNTYQGGSYYTPPEPKKNSPAAIVSLTMGILALLGVCCCGSGALFGVAGIISAIISAKGQKMSGMAIAGLVLSIIGTLFSAIYLLSLIGFINNPAFIQAIEEGVQEGLYGTRPY